MGKDRFIKFDEWLKENNFNQEATERYTIKRFYLFELWEKNFK